MRIGTVMVIGITLIMIAGGIGSLSGNGAVRGGNGSGASIDGVVLHSGGRANNTTGDIIVFGPYLQDVKTTAVTVMWRTSEAVIGEVQYGLNTSYGMSRSDSGAVSTHEVILTDLQPDTTYHYRIKSGSYVSEDYTFTTAEAYISPYNFLVYGNSRYNHTAHQEVVEGMLNESARFVINTGDMVNDGTSYSDWVSFFNDITPMARNVSYYAAKGTHEGDSQYYEDFFSLPNNEQWYSFDYGQVHIIVLNTNDYTGYMGGSSQYNWLINDLQANQQDWKFRFVVMNHGPYSASNNDTTQTLLRNTFDQVFIDYKVQVVFSGYEAYYSHSIKNGIHYIVTGGGGAPLTDPNDGTKPSWVTKAEEAYHYMRVSVNNGDCTIEAVLPNGSVIDKFSIGVSNKAPGGIACWAQDKPYDNGGAIEVDWDQSADDEGGENDVTGYFLFRADSSGQWAQLGTFPPATTHYEDTNVVDGESYYYYVIVTDGVYYVSSNLAGPVSAEDNLVPEPPASLSASDVPNDKGHSIKLTWTKSVSSDVEEYLIYRDTSDGAFPESTHIASVPASQTSWVDDNATTDQPYYYALRASDGTHLSPLSNVAGPVKATWDKPPQPPSGFKAEDVPDDTGGSVKLTWTKSTGDRPGGDVTEYHIYRAEEQPHFPAEPAIVVEAGTTEYVDTGLDPDTYYYYKIYSYDGYLESVDGDMAGPVKPEDNTIPQPPAEMYIKNVKDTEMKLLWDESPSLTTVGYRVYINTSPVDDNMMYGKYDGEWTQLDIVEGTETSYTATNLAPSTKYAFTVQPYSENGKGPDLTLCPQAIETTLSPPMILGASAYPDNITNEAGSEVVIVVTVVDGDGPQDIVDVSIDITSISPSLGTLTALNDGNDPDEVALDDRFTASFTMPPDVSPGEYQITVKSRDQKFLEREYSFTITILDKKLFENTEPRITSYTPSDKLVGIYIGESANFSVQAADDDGDSLDITWYLNGKKIGTGNEVSVKPVEVGTYTVKVVVEDGRGGEASRTWQLTMSDYGIQDENTGGGSEETNKEESQNTPYAYYAVAAVLIVVVLVVAAVLWRKKKGRQQQQVVIPPPQTADEGKLELDLPEETAPEKPEEQQAPAKQEAAPAKEASPEKQPAPENVPDQQQVATKKVVKHTKPVKPAGK